MKKFLIALFVMLVTGIIYFFIKYPKNIFIPYRPQGSSYQTEENQQEKRYPARELDEAADSVRKYTILDLDQALKGTIQPITLLPKHLKTLSLLDLLNL